MLINIEVQISNQGLHPITEKISAEISKRPTSEGLCTLFLQHTSASLLIQENYDDSARRDLENWLNRLVPEDDSIYTHTLEGPDDMPAHIKSALTNNQITLSLKKKKLMLGTWQGLYLFEHRIKKHTRTLSHHLIGE